MKQEALILMQSNAELSCAAAALPVKPVRVGVSLGDLLYCPYKIKKG